MISEQMKMRLVIPTVIEAAALAMGALIVRTSVPWDPEAFSVCVGLLASVVICNFLLYVAESLTFMSDSKIVLAMVTIALVVIAAVPFCATSYLASGGRELITGYSAVSLASKSLILAALCILASLMIQGIAEWLTQYERELKWDALKAEIEEIKSRYPTYPLDTSYTAELRRLMRENPTLPVVVFASGERVPEGTYAHCPHVRCELIEYLDVDTPWSLVRVERSREDFAQLIEDQLRACRDDYEVPEGVDVDDWIHEAAVAEAAKWDSHWVRAIAIFVDVE